MVSILNALDLLLALLRPAVFAAGALTAIAAVASHSARTRRLSPFSAGARFVREKIDPWLITPVEHRVLRAGGNPQSAPWWALAAVVIGGLLLLSGVAFIRDQLAMLLYATQRGSLLYVLIKWTFGILQIALFARVISSWVGGSPYSKWWKWSYVITEPILAPLRRVVPTIGMFDITVIVAYFGLQILESVVLRAF
jgi:YggT family protein